jgi:fucose permease
MQKWTRKANAEVLLSCAAFILIGANDGAFGVLIPGIRAFYRVDAATLSWLFLLSVSGYLTSSFNNGLLTARLGERRFLLLAMALFGVGVGLVSLRLPFVLYLGIAALLGFGVGMLDAGTNAYIASLPGNAALLNYLHAFYGAGALLGPLVASTLLALQLGWQATYITWMAVALVIWVGLWLAFKPRLQPVKEFISPKKEHLMLDTLRLRGVWLAALFLLVYVGTEISLSTWSYSFLTIARLGPALFSAWVVSGYWCGLTIGRLTLARLASRLGMRRQITLCLEGVVLGLLLAWFLPSIWGAAFGLCLTGFFLGPLFPTTIALMSHIAPARLLPSAIGLLASLGSAGAALFPAFAGNLLQHLGFWTLLPFALALTVIMFGVWLLLNKQPAQKG